MILTIIGGILACVQVGLLCAAGYDYLSKEDVDVSSLTEEERRIAELHNQIQAAHLNTLVTNTLTISTTFH